MNIIDLGYFELALALSFVLLAGISSLVLHLGLLVGCLNSAGKPAGALSRAKVLPARII